MTRDTIHPARGFCCTEVLYLTAAVGVPTEKGVSAEIVGKLAWLLIYLSGAGILLSESLKKTPQ